MSGLFPKRMKKVLVLTYYWPPGGGSGVQRWMYFCRYLNEFGYEPIVVTVDPRKASYRFVDESLLEQVAHVRTVRTNAIDPLKFYSILTSGNARDGIPHGEINKRKKGVFSRLSAYVRGNFFIPDSRIGWKRYALKAAMRIIREEQVNLVITTGPPHSTHLTGLALKRKLGVKWLADFRDPWTDIYYNKDLMRTKRSEQKDAGLERTVMHEADIVLTIGERLRELLLSKSDFDPEKFRVIYNGFDAEKMDRIVARPHAHFEATFIGLLTGNQPYPALIEVFRAFLKSNPDAPLRFSFAGNQSDEVRQSFEEAFPGRVTFYGYIGHGESMQLMKDADLLLNCLAEMENNEILVSGKQMEYLATGNPILCVGNERGESALLFGHVQNAALLEKTRVSEMTAFIQKVYDQWAQKTPLVNATQDAFVAGMSRKNTTGQLAAILNEL